MTRAPTLLLSALALSASAHAAPKPADRVNLAVDVGAAARYVDNTALSDPTGFGLSVGLRSELNALIHLRGDVRYLEGRAFDPAEDRFFDGSVTFRTPRLLFVSVDVFELYGRTTSRLGDGLVYVNGGLGFGGNILGSSLTVGVGASYLTAPDPGGFTRERAIGMYVGAEWLLRLKPVHIDLRAAPIIALNQKSPYVGVLADTTITVRLPLGRRGFIGPQIDAAYRNLGVVPDGGLLFGQRHEFTAHLGLAIGVRVPKRPDARDAPPPADPPG